MKLPEGSVTACHGAGTSGKGTVMEAVCSGDMKQHSRGRINEDVYHGMEGSAKHPPPPYLGDHSSHLEHLPGSPS